MQIMQKIFNCTNMLIIHFILDEIRKLLTYYMPFCHQSLQSYVISNGNVQFFGPPCTICHLTFWISLLLSVSLSSKFGLRPKISHKVKSFFFVWTQRLAERLAETKLRAEQSLNPKLIDSPVDFAYVNQLRD